VSRYVAGKVDWLSSGRPIEGEWASELRIGSIAHAEVSTCRLGQRIGELDVEDGLCVVINDECIVLGDLRGAALRADPRTPVEDVMSAAPATYRPNVSAKEMGHHMLETGARRVLVADADGRLMGWLTLEGALRALDQTVESTVSKP
jgi:predicted transcriptional regulator